MQLIDVVLCSHLCLAISVFDVVILGILVNIEHFLDPFMLVLSALFCLGAVSFF